ncbi:hypothetical protein BAE44_0018782 [Dichanthelium oligosanthes]|uniref:Uncharacterized protein n=1 Tax=Dichanthelium oligosanthes TaxID=888268 RepID=A0A1E5V4W0_9POAL|nr:hypothetical protein BAE44_0018782 [Dichanthelium oligosanthes]
MNLHRNMEREQMRMAILKQEQIFRQQFPQSSELSTLQVHQNFSLPAFLLNHQVHELHRLYHVQKQLMQQMPTAAPLTRSPAIVDVKPKPQLDIWHSERATNPQQLISFSSYKAHAPAPAPAEGCNLELTLATGPSSSSGSGNAERQQGKRLKSSSNSDSGTTAVSSTSTDSDLAQFRKVDVTAATVRFHSESRRMDETGQGPWMYQCLSLKTA